MPPVILKPDNFNADRMIVNVQSGQELIEVTRRVYKLPLIGIEFWTGYMGITSRRRFDLTEQIPQDPITLYVKLRAIAINQDQLAVPDGTSLIA